ncbi:thioredoxin family protein [Thermospira aquatica]|uniref:TM0996/MTH895 family glutaredoxin-like protein n=1 Tax=Thermospira aquatica TaxID=2828656 RepID=A0AAX3BI41_9SPIR|nr:thioredoxin family protein [Thermospira aquatica]URA11041.1 TM0996/MTH895 family glutaredoxin-like protein [Thermospira aquatica]
MKIAILGSGCPNCIRLEENARKALQITGKQAEIEKVTDIDKIMEYGVMRTPALVINGEVKSFGRVLTPEQIAEIFQAY